MAKNKIILFIVVLIINLGLLGGCSVSNNTQIQNIINAIDNNDLERIEELLNDKKLNINERPYTFKFYAAMTEKTNIPPLHYACMRNNIEAVKLLIDNGADVNLIVDDKSPLMYCQYGSYALRYKEIVFLLIENGANVSYLNKNNNSILYGLMNSNYSLDNSQAQYEIFKIVIEIDSTLIDKDFLYNGKKWNYLHFSSYYNNTQIVEYLIINLNYDIDERDSDNETSLMIASKNDNYEVTNTLLINGADKSLKNSDGKNAYELAIENNSEKVIELLK